MSLDERFFAGVIKMPENVTHKPTQLPYVRVEAADDTVAHAVALGACTMEI